MSWRTVPIRSIYQRVELRGRPDLPLLSVYRDHGVVPREGRDDNNNRPSEDLSAYKHVRPGDLVVNKMKTWQGSLAVSDYEGIVSPAYFIGRRVTDVDNRFMHHLLRSLPLIAEYGARSKGIRPSQWDLPWDEFAAIKVSLPSASEQRAIADYLDTETTRIDELITKKQRMCSLVAESGREFERVLLLHSGHPLVPARWFMRVGSGVGLAPEEMNAVGQTRVIGGNGILGFTSEPGFVSECSVAVGRVGALCGNVHLLEPGDWVTDNALWVRGLRGWDPRYLAACLRSLKLNDLADKTAQPLITGEAVKSQRVPKPPVELQLEIVSELDVRSVKQQAVIGALSGQIDLLRERRQALITAAVTGEFEVPGVAA